MLLWLIVLLAVIYIYIVYAETKENRPNLQPKLDAANATLYGASWCHYTLLQQRELEKMNLTVKYVECAGKSQRHCQKVTAFPTWRLNKQMIPGYMDAEALTNLLN